MTINELQKTIIKDLEHILAEFAFIDSRKKKKKIKAYPQALPITESLFGWSALDQECGQYFPDSESPIEDGQFPYAIVRVEDIDYHDSGGRAITWIGFGIYNNDLGMQGYYELFNVMEKVVSHYRANTVLEAFYCDTKMQVAVQDDNSYPYFFGGIQMTWNIPAMVREGDD